MVDRLRANITRRSFAGMCVVAAAARGTAFDSVSQIRSAQSISSSTANTAIDQNPIRRRGTGFRALDASRASPGLTLFSPIEGDGMIYLIDLTGKIDHTWKMPYPPGLYGYLTDKGTLFYNGKIPNDTLRPHVGRRAQANWASAAECAGVRQEKCGHIHCVGKSGVNVCGCSHSINPLSLEMSA